jgi:flavin reductase (DIM6/NTAB) family NADH-FMN oxidoreductase RutF
MKISRNQLRQFDKIKRLNIVNSITGFKPANLIGTLSDAGIPNLTIVSSVLHLSSSPAMIGFMQRPTTVPRHTYKNIKENGYFTINHVHTGILPQAHYTSAKFPEEISEFEASGLHEEYLDDFKAPFVQESKIKIGLRFEEEYHIKASNTILVVGQVEMIILPENIVTENGQLNLEDAATAVISGLNNYYGTTFLNSFPYARPGKMDDALKKS